MSRLVQGPRMLGELLWCLVRGRGLLGCPIGKWWLRPKTY